MVEEEPADSGLRISGGSRKSSLALYYQLSDLLENRNILSQLSKREIAAKYRQSYLGMLWSIIEPILLAITYYFLFVILRGNTDHMYSVWILLGVIIWGCFARTLMGAVTSLSHNSGMIQAIYFPRVIYPSVNMVSNIRITMLSCLVIIPIMVVAKLQFTLYLILVLPSIIMAGLLGLGIGLIFAPLNCFNRDVEHLFRFITRAGFFLSPVMWTMEMALERGKLGELTLFNPMAVPLTLIRDGVSGNAPSIDLIWIAYSCGFILLSWVVGAYFFEKNQAEAVKHL